ncbi:MAG TPA: histidine phosphatase family protein [Candidatus Limnocylindria bacterium]|nr:histidine phosphatase family protein [Candidatus Limnocylindria bacterium]
MIRRLLLVRHGVTTWNREGRFQGRLDPPLDPLGELEATYLAERLATEEPRPSWIVSSPLQRAVSTARILRDRLAPDGELELDDGLVEISAGEWEGSTHAELRARDGQRYAAWRDSGGELEPPGGESLPAARQRVAATVDALLSGAPDGTDTLLLVSHGGILRLAAGQLLGLPDAAVWDWEVHNASLSTLAREATGDWRVVTWNDVGHLRGRPDLDRDEADGQPLIL